jgi:rifampicin phosphotransferase
MTMEKYIFDNSNIAESYSGVTTPLTYSFARYAYQEVYKHFCRMMGVGERTIDQHKEIFPRMVVFIGYRMYYDLINWYTLVSFLPGYKFNREFFEKMLGVQKGYNHSHDEKSSFFQKYFIILPRLLFQTIGILSSFILMGHLVTRFNKRFDRAFGKLDTIKLHDLDLKQLEGLYLRLHEDLTVQWRIPIANDFAVMVSTGMADSLFKKWLNESNVYPYLYSKSHSSLVSLDPGLQMMEIVTLIRNDLVISQIFKREQNPSSILNILQKDLADHCVTNSIFKYLEKFGSRTPNELKLETTTLSEKPEIFIELLKNLVNSKDSVKEDFAREERVEPKKCNTLNIVKRIIIAWSLGWAAKSIERREETRFRRSLIFGYARKIFLAVGQKFYQDGILDSCNDIFYLTTDEISEFIRKGEMGAVLKNMACCRKKEFEYWQPVELPRRMETSMSIAEIEEEFKAKNRFQGTTIRPNVLRGVVASRPKIDSISGMVLVLPEFNPSVNFEGKILVTKQTDPGWTIVFPLLKGLIVERGGMLSHAAIVARELNIPCIVGVDNATTFIEDGSHIQMDLDKGEIHA